MTGRPRSAAGRTGAGKDDVADPRRARDPRRLEAAVDDVVGALTRARAPSRPGPVGPAAHHPQGTDSTEGTDGSAEPATAATVSADGLTAVGGATDALAARAPAVEVPLRAEGPADGLAEDAAELQHPVLQRLSTGDTVGTAVRRSAAWGAGSRVAAQALQFLGTIITARLLLPSDYGKTAVIFPVIAFGNLFATLGLSPAVIHARRVTERLLSTAFWANAAAGVLLGLLTAALAVPLAALFRIPDLVPLLLVASLVFPVNLGIVHLALLERTLRFKQIALVETACAALGIAVTIATAAAGAGAYSLVIGPVTTAAAVTVCLWALVRWRPHRAPDRESTRDLWQYSRGVTGFQLLNFWSRNADNLLLARFVPLAELGNYSRAYNLMQLPVLQMNNLMGRVLFPALTRLRDDRPRMGRAWLRALGTASAAIAPVTFGMAVSAPALIEVLFGPRWLGMVPVLQLLAVAALPHILTTTVASLLKATGATDVLFRLGVVTSIMSVSAVLVGLPWGTVGVASALVVKYYVEVVVSLTPCLRQLDLRWRDLVGALRGVWLSCVVLAGAGIAVRAALDGSPAVVVLLAQVAACGLAYTATLWLAQRDALLQLLELGSALRRRTRSS